VWDPRELPIRGPWFTDGPLLPVEFARQSNDGRLTLVLLKDQHSIPLVRSLWALFSVSDLDVARQALADREGVGKERANIDIGVWSGGEAQSAVDERIAVWGRCKHIESVMWTNLPPKFAGEERRTPSIEEAVHYLQQLPNEKRQLAERYIRMAARQIDTDYRRRFEAEFGWTPVSPI
jgi:hypothetical protein